MLQKWCSGYFFVLWLFWGRAISRPDFSSRDGIGTGLSVLTFGTTAIPRPWRAPAYCLRADTRLAYGWPASLFAADGSLGFSPSVQSMLGLKPKLLFKTLIFTAQAQVGPTPKSVRKA